MDDRGIPIESSIFECKADKIFDRYDKIGKDRIRDIAKLKSNIPEIFPNFNRGQDSSMIEANLPFSMDRTKERVVTPTDKIANILSLEHFKQMSLDENFFKLDIATEKRRRVRSKEQILNENV